MYQKRLFAHLKHMIKGPWGWLFLLPNQRITKSWFEIIHIFLVSSPESTHMHVGILQILSPTNLCSIDAHAPTFETPVSLRPLTCTSRGRDIAGKQWQLSEERSKKMGCKFHKPHVKSLKGHCPTINYRFFLREFKYLSILQKVGTMQSGISASFSASFCFFPIAHGAFVGWSGWWVMSI